jgi:protocatechuate 3,4-dioxygenase beta subunit
MIRRLLFATSLVLVCAAPLIAQGVTVSGTVVDETGARVPGAVVTLAGPNVRATSTTDAAGEYRFTDIASGNYEISVMASGFASARPA